MRARDLAQNLIIAALSLSAMFLFSRTQFFRLRASAGGEQRRYLTAARQLGTESSDLSLPVRCAVTGAYGRYGSVCLTTEAEEFAPVKRLLGEVLGSAHSRRAIAREDFLAALDRTSVYCDFLVSLPVEHLSRQMGAEVESPLSARALAAAEQGESVVVLLWDGDSGYYQCASAALPATLTEVLAQFELGLSSFAFEQDGDLSPLSLFPDPLPQLPQLTVPDTPIDTGGLLSVLGFNPHTNARYEESGGTQVIVENDRSLRIDADRTVVYASGGEDTVSIDAAGATPTIHEAISGVSALVQRLGDHAEAQLYLAAYVPTAQETRLTFQLHFQGIPIRLPGGAAAAEVVLTGRSVSFLTVRLRPYRSTETMSLLLPLAQALAVAPREEGTELSIGYADRGAYPLSAAWLAD